MTGMESFGRKALEDEYEAGKLKVIGGAVASTIFNR